jgi:bZIP factor
MELLPNDRHILDWDESDVHTWFSSLGYPQYERQIRGFVLQFPHFTVLLTPIKSTGSWAMLFAYSTRRVSKQSAFLLLARDYLSLKPCTTSNSHTTFASMLMIMCHNVGALGTIRVHVSQILLTAEAPERVEQVSLDSLHTMIKEQGAVPASIATLNPLSDLHSISSSTYTESGR